MLQTLKEKFGKKLVNNDAYAFSKFLQSYGKAAGKLLYGSDLKSITKSDFVISVGAALRNDNPNARYAFNNIQKMNKGAGLYFHPIADGVISDLGKSVMSMTHKAGLEEVALYLILDLFADKEKLPEVTKAYIESFHKKSTKTITEKVMESVTETVVDEATGESKEVTKKVPKSVEKEVEVVVNELVSILGGGDDFADAFAKMMAKKESFSLIVGEDLYFHPKAENLAKLVALIESTSEISVVMIPPKTNSLGVALICDLDASAEGYTVGYNENGDFTLSALGNGDLDMPAMNQQEGTLTNINKLVVPTNAALEYHGYELNDLMRALDCGEGLTVDWTPKLASKRGFEARDFDSLPNGYTNSGEEHRGYPLVDLHRRAGEVSVEEFDASIALEGEIAYRCNPQRQFNDFTDKSHEIFEKFGLYASNKKAEELGSKVEVDFGGVSRVFEVIVDERMEGDIVKISDFRSADDIYTLFGENRFKNVTMRKV
jgi:NADH-quinone oxidoreductase subunit G